MRHRLSMDEREQLVRAMALLQNMEALLVATQEELVKVRAERDVLFVALGRKHLAVPPATLAKPAGTRVCERCGVNPAKKNICSACKSLACRAAAFKRIEEGGVMFMPKRRG